MDSSKPLLSQNSPYMTIEQNGIPEYKLEVPHQLEPRFVIKRMEDIEDKREAATEKAHRHEYFVILWVEEGKGTHFIDFAEYPLENQSVFFISPAQIHLVQPEKTPLGTAILFKPEFLHLVGLTESFLIESGLFHDFDHAPIQLSPNHQQLLAPVCQQLFSIHHQAGPLQQELLAAYLKVFLLHSIQIRTTQLPEANSHSRHQTIICDFRKLLDHNYQEKHKVSDYADAMHLTPNHLNEVIKKNTGKTAKEHIQNRLIMEAQRNALHTDCTLQEITYHLGFKDPAHFSKFFKKHNGMTFQEYRNQVRNIYQ